MKLQQLTDEQLIGKKNNLLKQLETAKGYTRNDIYKALDRIEKERVRRAWEKR